MVWCAITCDRVIGPYFFADSVTGNKYRIMLQQYFWPKLSLSERRKSIFQQDGAGAHYKVNVRTWLNSHFPDRWIGRATSKDKNLLKWPARSPDLAPPDW